MLIVLFADVCSSFCQRPSWFGRAINSNSGLNHTIQYMFYSISFFFLQVLMLNWHPTYFSRFLLLVKILPCWMALKMQVLKWKKQRFVFQLSVLFCDTIYWYCLVSYSSFDIEVITAWWLLLNQLKNTQKKERKERSKQTRFLYLIKNKTHNRFGSFLSSLHGRRGGLERSVDSGEHLSLRKVRRVRGIRSFSEEKKENKSNIQVSRWRSLINVM